MGWQWSNGRLISDEEAGEEFAASCQFLAFLIPTCGLGWLGYALGGKWLMLGLGIIGAVIGVAFNAIILVLMMIAIAIAVIAGVCYIFSSIK